MNNRLRSVAQETTVKRALPEWSMVVVEDACTDGDISPWLEKQPVPLSRPISLEIAPRLAPLAWALARRAAPLVLAALAPKLLSFLLRRNRTRGKTEEAAPETITLATLVTVSAETLAHAATQSGNRRALQQWQPATCQELVISHPVPSQRNPAIVRVLMRVGVWAGR